MAMDQALPSESIQKRLGLLRASLWLEKDLVLAKSVEEPAPGGTVAVFKQAGKGLIDLAGGAAVLSIKESIGMGQELVSHMGHGREMGQPVNLRRGKLFQIAHSAVVVLPGLEKCFFPPGGRSF